jgi:hypothetical protein
MTLKLLVEEGDADIRRKSIGGTNCIHLALCQATLQTWPTVDYLLAQAPDPRNEADDDGCSPKRFLDMRDTFEAEAACRAYGKKIWRRMCDVERRNQAIADRLRMKALQSNSKMPKRQRIDSDAATAHLLPQLPEIRGDCPKPEVSLSAGRRGEAEHSVEDQDPAKDPLAPQELLSWFSPLESSGKQRVLRKKVHPGTVRLHSNDKFLRWMCYNTDTSSLLEIRVLVNHAPGTFRDESAIP